MIITSRSTFTLPAGSAAVFHKGGSGKASVFLPSVPGQIYTVGVNEAFLGPYEKDASISVEVDYGSVEYIIDSTGYDFSDLAPAIAAISERLKYVVSDAAETPTQATARINDALASAPAAGTTLLVRLLGDFTTNAPIVVYSNTTLDIRSARIYSAATTHPQIRNFSDGSTTTRDSNIWILGGKLSAGATDGDTHRIKMHRVDGLHVSGQTISSLSGKYAISIADVSDFYVSDVFMNDVASDGVHVTGPARRGVIEKIRGNPDDDMIALGCSDYLAYDYSRGDVTDIIVRDIQCDNMLQGRGVMLFTTGDASITNTLAIRNVLIDGVQGQVGASAVYLDDYVANVNAKMDGVTIRNVFARVPAGYPMVGIDALTTLRGVAVDGVTIPSDAFDDTTAVKINRPIASLSVRGIRSAVTNTAVAQTMIGVAANTTNLVLSDICVDFTTNGFSRVLRVYNNATLQSAVASNCAMTGNNESFRVDSGSTLSRLHLSNVSLGSTGSLVRNRASTAIDVLCSGVYCGNVFLGFDTAGGSATVRGSGIVLTGGTQIQRSAAQVIRSKSHDFPVDLSVLGRNLGDVAYNTNAGLSCGVGPVVSDGTLWKHLYTGATY